MSSLRSGLAALLGLGALAGSVHAYAAEHMAHTPEAFQAAVRVSGPGDSVVLANGVWRDFERVFVGEGTAAMPITLRAQTSAKVISGQLNLRAGRHLVVSGLTFKNGFSPPEVISPVFAMGASLVPLSILSIWLLGGRGERLVDPALVARTTNGANS